jgi:hypothetical protein
MGLVTTKLQLSNGREPALRPIEVAALADTIPITKPNVAAERRSPSGRARHAKGAKSTSFRA